MALSGFSPILLFGSTTSGNTPSASNLLTNTDGVEIAINAADGKIFYKDTSGTIQVIASKAAASGLFTNITASGLTAGRVNYNGTGGLLVDSANLTFDGTTLTANKVTSTNDASIHGLTVGLGGGSVATNTAFGYSALTSNTSGNRNTAIGYFSTIYNTTGVSNTALGISSLYTNTTGNNNVAIGDGAVTSNTTGSNNIGIGVSALQANTTASNNTAVGYQAAYSTTTGSPNVAIGYQSLYSNTNGTNNTAVGASAMYSNVNGYYNAAFGLNALYSNTSGAQNVAIGQQALNSNTTANNNTALGFQAGYGNTTGYAATYVGYQAGYSGTTSTYNTFIGFQAGFTANSAINTGINTGVGYQAGYGLTTGIDNTFIGPLSGSAVTTGSNNSILGGYTGSASPISATGSNWIVLSDGAATIGAYYQTTGANGWYQKNNSTVWSTTSDIRIKKNIISLESGLNVITALRPVEFDYIKNDKHDIGFIAQEYREVLPAQISEGEDGMLALNQNLVPYLVKAIQEQQALITDLQARLTKAGL